MMKPEKYIRYPDIPTDLLEGFNLEQLRDSLSHVLWIGGATDAGKTTIAQKLAERHNLQVYHYDRHDVTHHYILIEKNIRSNTNKTMEETWIDPTPIKLLEGCIQGFIDRFPLMIDDLLTMPKNSMILAEGFGVLPELIMPILSDARKVVYLFPTATFKYESMERRNKLAGLGDKAEFGRRNLFIRDMLLSDYIHKQSESYAAKNYLIDGSKSILEMTSLIEEYFKPFL
jgi:hypothetical protein